MSKKTEEILDNIQSYGVAAFIVLILFDIIFGAVSYNEYGVLFGCNKAIDGVLFFSIGVTIVLLVVLIVISVILKRQQGDLYVDIGDFFENVFLLFFPVGARSKKETLQLLEIRGEREQVTASALWKTAAKGLHIWNLIKAILLFAFAGAVVYTVVMSWIDLDDDRVFTTVLGSIFALVSYFWCIVCAFGVKRRPDGLLDYVMAHEIPFEILIQDFAMARNIGNEIYKSSQYLFLNLGKGMEVLALNEITKCEVIRMGGFNPRRLFLTYHLLQVSTAEQTVIKYGINPVPFFKLKEEMGV